PIWSKDGKWIVYTRAHATGKDSNIFLADIATGKAANLTPHEGEHNFAANDISADGKMLLITSNAHNGYDNVGLLEIATKKITWLTTDIWVYDFAASKTHQVTHSLVGGVRSEDMAEPFLVHYPSTDGKWQISAFVYVPYNAERNGQNAAIVYIHGGPAAQTVNSFNK